MIDELRIDTTEDLSFYDSTAILRNSDTLFGQIKRVLHKIEPSLGYDAHTHRSSRFELAQIADKCFVLKLIKPNGMIHYLEYTIVEQ